MISESGIILIIEDSEEDFQTVKRLLGKITGRTVGRCADAPSALHYLEHIGDMPNGHACPRPDVTLLDLNMPGEDGRKLLVRLKADVRIRRIPVIILTTSANPKDVEFCYDNGAAGFIVKPVDLPRFRASLEKFAEYWLHAVLLPNAGASQ